MRGNQDFQGAMFSYISLEERVPATHPLRKLRAAVDALLATMNREFDAVYARRGRPSVPPGMLLKALLLLQQSQHSSAVCSRQAWNHRSPALCCIRSASC